MTGCIPTADKARLLDQLRTLQVALETDDNQKTACTLQDAALKAAVHMTKALQATDIAGSEQLSVRDHAVCMHACMQASWS